MFGCIWAGLALHVFGELGPSGDVIAIGRHSKKWPEGKVLNVVMVCLRTY
jgi:hypothetical protein